MARISSYGQDGTVSTTDKVLGTDSATGATKNYTVNSLLGLVNEENLVETFDGAAFEYQSYVDPANDPQGVINLNTSTASNADFSAINTLYISVKDKSGNSLAEYFENADNDFIKISKTDNLNQFGIYQITDISDYGNGTYKRLSLTPRGTNGTLTVGAKYFVANYSALFDQDFSDDSVTEFADVTSAGSGEIITGAERASLNNFTNNGLVHADVVDNVTSTATDVPLSAAQGKVLKNLIDTINTLLTSDNIDLDSLQEVVDFIETNREDLNALGISNITGLQDALDLKQNTEAGKGLSANDFTTILKDKLNSIAENAEVNVNADWSAGAGDAQILNKPTDLTNLSIHDATELRDISHSGSGFIITGDERTKLFSVATGAEVNVQSDWDAISGDSLILNKPALAPSDAEQNVQANWNESDTNSDAFIQNKPSVALDSRTLQISGTANEIEVDLTGAQDLTADRAWTVGLPDDVTIASDLTVGDSIQLANPQTTAPTFNNGFYHILDGASDTLHFKYGGKDLSIDYLTEVLPTGILNGGELTKANNTQFTIAAGDGIINDLNKTAGSDPHPEIIKVEWAQQTITVSNLTVGDISQLNSWIYVDSTGTVQQQAGAFTDAQKRTNIIIGSAVHSEGVLKFVKTFPITAYNSASQLTEFANIFGPLKKSGHKISANGANLSIDRSAGVAFALGRNYVNDPENPSTVSDSAQVAATIHRYYRDGSDGFILDDGIAGAGYTVLDPSKHDNGTGTLATTPAGQFSVQRLYYFPGTPNLIISYYGHDEYNSLDIAEKNYSFEDFSEFENTANQAIYLGAIIMKGGTTALNDPADVKILTAGSFRGLASVNLGGVAADANLGDLGDVSTTGVSNGQALVYDSASTRWEPGDVSTDLTPITLDTVNNRVGIGTATPASELDVNGDIVADNIKIASSILRENDAANAYISFPDGGEIKIGSDNGKITANGDTLTIHEYGSDDKAIFMRGYSDHGLLQIMNNNSVGIQLDGDGSYGSSFFNTGNFGIGTASPVVSLHVGATDAMVLPSGTIAQRPSSPAAGMFRYNSEDDQFEGYTTEWGAIAGGGGSGEIVKETFSGTGSQAAFTLGDTIADIDNINVYVNGVYQYPSNYTTSGNTVTFVSGSIPASGTDNIHVRHNVTAPTITEGSAFSTSGNLTGDGATTSFALGGSPRSSDHVMVFLEGVYQEKENYSISGSNIVFTTPPPNGYSIEAKFVTGILNLAQPLDFGEIALDEFIGDGTTTYTLSSVPLSENYTNVYIEGVYQEKGTYSLAGSNIVFDSNIPLGYSVEVSIHKTIAKETVVQTAFQTDEFTADGTTTDFALVNGSPSSKSLTMVFIQGVYQSKSNYDLLSNEIRFTAGTPDEDDVVEVISMSAINTVASSVTSVNGEVGAVTAVSSVNGQVGAVTVASKHDVSVINASASAEANTLYVLTANLDLTLPASPVVGDSIKISNRSGVDTCQLLRNGNNILGAAEDLTLNTASASFELIYTDVTNGWVIIGQ